MAVIKFIWMFQDRISCLSVRTRRIFWYYCQSICTRSPYLRLSQTRTDVPPRVRTHASSSWVRSEKGVASTSLKWVKILNLKGWMTWISFPDLCRSVCGTRLWRIVGHCEILPLSRGRNHGGTPFPVRIHEEDAWVLISRVNMSPRLGQPLVTLIIYFNLFGVFQASLWLVSI